MLKSLLKKRLSNSMEIFALKSTFAASSSEKVASLSATNSQT